MNKYNNTPYVFLVELVLNFAIFIVASLTCISLIVNANSLNTQSIDLTNSVYIGQEIIEFWQQDKLSMEENLYKQSFDKNWEPNKDDSEYVVTLEEVVLSDHLKEGKLTVSKNEKEIYSINVKKVYGEVPNEQ